MYMMGADPELFLRSKKTGKFRSAHGKFPGDKKKPFKLEYGAVQVDGLALEFNIEPAKDAKEFTRNIQAVVKQLRDMVKKASNDLEMVFTPYADFDPAYFNRIAKSAKVLGCDADYTYDGKINPRPVIGNLPFRTAAGHLHVGWGENLKADDPGHFEDCRFISHHFYFNTRLSANGNNLATPAQQKRLQYYGMNGSFRPKSYGVELRSPSNEWVESKEENIRIYNFVMSIMNNMKTNY